MRANPRANTAIEVSLRSALHRRGLRFRKDRRIVLPHGSTRADIAFVGLQVAVFIDGCFWHNCPRHGTQPRHNAWYWRRKLRRNRERDVASTDALRALGWTVLRFWEHRDQREVLARVVGVVARARGAL